MSIFYQGTEVDILTKAEIIPNTAKTSIVRINFGRWDNGIAGITIEHKLGAAPNSVALVPCEWIDDAGVSVPMNAECAIETMNATFKNDGTRVQSSFTCYSSATKARTQSTSADNAGIVAVDGEKVSLRSVGLNYYFTPNVDYFLICTRYEA